VNFGGRSVGVALLDPTDRQRTHGLVQIAHDSEFFSGGHASDDLKLEALQLGGGIGE